MTKEKRYNLRTTEGELATWRAAALAAGIRDLSTWIRMLATREVRRARAKSTR